PRTRAGSPRAEGCRPRDARRCRAGGRGCPRTARASVRASSRWPWTPSTPIWARIPRAMAVETPPAELGAACPDFRLPAVDGKTYARDDFRAKPVLVVMFICNHCPYVKAVEDRLIRLGRDFEPRGVQFVAVCAND